MIKQDQLGFVLDWECDTGSRWSVEMDENDGSVDFP